MKKVSGKGVKVIKLIHLVFVFMWLGGGIALLLGLFLSQPENIHEYYMKYRILMIIENYLVIPGAMGNLLLGFVYGLYTKWGFFKHTWVTIKWILTVLVILFGIFFLGPWLTSILKMLKPHNPSVLSSESIENFIELSKLGSLQIVVLLFMVYLSVFKPFKIR
jgi:hypothetical protein